MINYVVGLFPNGLLGNFLDKVINVPIISTLFKKFLYFIIPKKIKLNDGLIINLNRNDPYVSGSISLGLFERGEIKLFKSTISKGYNIIDIGANIGIYTLIAAKLSGDSGKIFSFEPYPQNFEILNSNILINNFKNVECVAVAISNNTKKGRLYLSEYNMGDHQIFHSDCDRSYIEIDEIKLDDYFSEDLIKIDVIKIDIQGAEVSALLGMEKLVNRSTDLKIFVEFWPEGLNRAGSSPEQFINILLRFNFTINKIDSVTGELNLIEDPMNLLNNMNQNHCNLYCYRGL
jgi:FkbM family methyltransferase